MKQRLIVLIVAIVGLTVGLLHAPAVEAQAANRVITTTSVTKTAYLTKNSQGGLYQMSGPANNTKIKTLGKLQRYGNPTWFVTKQRQVRLANRTTAKYAYVTSANNRVKGWVKTGSIKKSTRSFTNLYNVAKSKLGHRYVYGAVGPNTFDCSGYTKYVFKQAAQKNLPRVAQAQYRQYRKISKQRAQKGDLVFFGSNTGSISHVGIYVGGGKMIDAQDNGVKNEKIYVPWWHAVGYCRPVNFGA
ncbi:gamma-D-glutamate-meso-diaminopimelate muropeptidase [Lactiplantibacillus plantarum EGD-AQ4]|nr:NlpC/P60 family protein [Lactiplantibacillus pentosus]EIW14459.1 extracellular protein, NlpC/P60 family, gamma-D-glutamate-meso-diaminopimelate muropeptidase [Lactiplantibacillus pentosus KCA1]EQM53789.1 gamma-D-glutamate-meso-diaminopimelate muropeptidase [Lactiplantibacillus plantarum EGD-AQ4]